MSKIINGELDQYGAGPFEQQQFGTAGVEGVNVNICNLFGWLVLILKFVRTFIQNSRERHMVTYRLTWHSASLLIVGLLIADQTVGTERVSTSQHLGVTVALEADHTLQ